MAGPRDVAALDAMAGRLRGDRLVLWAEVGSPRTVQPKSSRAAERETGRKLLVRLADGADPAAIAPRLAAAELELGQGRHGAHVAPRPARYNPRGEVLVVLTRP